ncbi:TMhelix containing protein [Vibrio phage 1.024.O._10N.261.45.F8]|nr:TMhelix containing protein [Vibrio phage 1.024.O._10N.261.45.F8]
MSEGVFYLVMTYCGFTYGRMFNEIDRLETHLKSQLHTAPEGTTEKQCKTFAIIAYLLAPLWFLRWLYVQLRK